MIDPFLLLAPVLILGILALVRFVGCSFHPHAAATPPPPSNLVAKAGDGRVDLTWDKVDSGYMYEVTRTTDGQTSPPVAGTSYADTSVINGMEYCYTVSWVLGNSASAPSSPAACATPAAVPGRPPGSVLDLGNPLSGNLIGLFLMNEGTGSEEGQPADDKNLVDKQPANHSGPVPPTWKIADPSVVFHGGAPLNSFLDGGIDPAFNDLPTNDITIVAYVNLQARAAGGICEKNDGNPPPVSDSGFVFGVDGNGALRLTVELSVTNMTIAAGALGLNQWTQVAFTWRGTVGNDAPASAAALFVNYVPQAPATAVNGSGTLDSSKAANSNPFRIGSASYDIAGSLNGRMAYLAIYKGRILTPTELQTLDTMLPIRPS